MEASFWHERWERNEIAFHQADGNPLMVAHFGVLGLKPGNRVFVPLCGKTGDIPWLLSRGFRVVGVELNEMAIQQLFEDLGADPAVETDGGFKRYSAGAIEVYVGDFFALDADRLGPVDAIYDRAALVALPEEMRVDYTKHLVSCSDAAPQLLITYEYDQSKLPGPPFSIRKAQVADYYSSRYQVKLLADIEISGGLKGKVESLETVWHLLPV